MIRRRGDRTCVITYNGELYNTEDIRRELDARGYTFQGHSDTEVLLLAYMEWGEVCLERLNGIYAFGVWNDGDQSLFLARDRLGVKPLFYADRGRSFLFGSEPKAILAHPDIKPEVDAEGLADLLIIGPARTPGHGIFRGVAELKPGHYLRYDRNGLRIHRYWGLESHPHADDLETTAQKVRWLLDDTVGRQLVSDVPICTLLSGGLDSSAITAFAVKALEGSSLSPVRTFCIDFKHNDLYFRPNRFQPDADGPWSQRMSAFLGTDHHLVIVDTPELVEHLVTDVKARDLPGMTDVDTSLYLFCREIKKKATVAISGEAADEVFGGYPWFHDREAMEADTFPWALMTPQRVRLLSQEVVAHIRPEEYVAERYSEALAEVPRLSGERPREARIREISYMSLTRFLPTLLDRKDRMSMAVGLEVRVPFCDHRLVEYVWNIPWKMKCTGGMSKGILRRALSGLLPEEVLYRRKSPYPKTHNPAYLDAVRRWLLAILADPSSPLHQLVDARAVKELAAREVDSVRPWFGQLMAGPQLFAYLVQIDWWLREYRVAIC